MKNNFEIRLIKESDAAAALSIYSPYVLNTIISFEYEPPTLDEYLQRIKTNTSEYPWLVCLYHDKIVGFAYGSKYRYRTAYNWSPESTVYMSDKFHRKGIARILYNTLFSILRLQGYFNIYAGVGLPNNASVKFHKALGFEDIGIFKKVGYKHGNWHDTQWFQLILAAHVLNPPFPKPIHEITNDETFKNILQEANDLINKTSA